jgi:subtilisin family serine protease
MAATPPSHPHCRSLLLAAASALLLLLLPRSAPAAPPDFVPEAPDAVRNDGDGAPDVEEMAKNRFIFLFRDDLPGEQARAHALDLAGRHGGQAEHVYSKALRGFSAAISPEGAARLARDPRIASYLRDGVVRIDGRPAIAVKPAPASPPPQSLDWGVKRVCTDPATGATLCPAYDNGSGRRAWIIDTGIDLDHRDLNVDVDNSVSFVRRGTPDDGNGHGTHVAGIVAAKNNGIGTVGVAAGAPVVSVRVLDRSGSGLWSWVLAGVDYVAVHAKRGDVANLSLGGPTIAVVDAAVENAARTCRFAVAAGNENVDAAGTSPSGASTSFQDDVYVVSAVGADDARASWSNWGNPPVDIAAPGVYIKSLYKGGGTAILSGTSMAAPHVAGLLLLGELGCDGQIGNDVLLGDDLVPDYVAHHRYGPSTTCPVDPYGL